MLRYRRYKRYILRFEKKYKYYNLNMVGDKYYNLYLIPNNMYNLMYYVRFRNKFFVFSDHNNHLFYYKSYIGTLVWKIFHTLKMFHNLFIELAAFYLAAFKWSHIKLIIKGLYKNLFHFYRYLYYNYYKYANGPLILDSVYLIFNEMFSYRTFKKYPARKRRFRRVR